MKKLALTITFFFCLIVVAFAQPLKSTGVWYFQGVPSTAPASTRSIEIAVSIDEKKVYVWDRTESEWVDIANQASLSSEDIEDVVAELLLRSSHDGISVSYDDVNGTLSIAADVTSQRLLDSLLAVRTEMPSNLSDLNNDTGYISNPDDADADPVNEIQALSITSDQLTLSGGGGTITLPSGGSGDWSDLMNVPDGFADDTDDVEDADADPANEIQAVTLDGNTLSLSGSLNVVQVATPDDVNAIGDSQIAGLVGFTTKAILDTTLNSYTENTIARIANDPVGGNNGYYRFDGSVWVFQDNLYASVLEPENEIEAVTGAAVDRYILDLRNGANFIDTTQFFAGFYNTGSGVQVSDAGRRCTGKQKVNPGEVIAIWNTGVGADYTTWVFFEEDGSTLSRAITAGNQTSQTVGAGEGWVARFTAGGSTQSLAANKNTVEMRLYEGTFDLPYSGPREQINNDWLPDLASSEDVSTAINDLKVLESENRLDTTQIFRGFIFSGVLAPNTGSSTIYVGYQKVIPGIEYAAYNFGVDGLGAIFFYDEDKNYLRTISGIERFIPREGEYFVAFNPEGTATQTVAELRNTIYFGFSPRPESYVAPKLVFKSKLNENTVEAKTAKRDNSALTITYTPNSIGIARAYNNDLEIVHRHSTQPNLNALVGGGSTYFRPAGSAINSEYKIKEAGDDIAPLFFNSGGATGANHGLTGFLTVAANSHGKVDVDVGSEWVDDNGDSWWIIEIRNANTLIVVGENASVTDVPSYDLTITGNLTHTEGATNTGSITIGSYSTIEYFPSVNNVSVTAIAEGTDTLTRSGMYYANKLDIIQTYDIIYPPSAVDSIIAHRGESPAPSVQLGEGVVSMSYRWVYLSDGTVLHDNDITTNKDIDLTRYGFYQFVPPTPVSTFTDVFFYLPRTNTVSDGAKNYDFTEFVNLTVTPFAAGTNINFTASTWEDATYPPERGMFLIGEGVPEHGFAHGYIPTRSLGDTLTRLSRISRAWNIGSGNKSYPFAIDNKLGSLSQGSYYGGMLYQKWFPVTDADKTTYWIDVTDNEAVLFADYQSAILLDKIALPAKYEGRSCEVVYKSENIKLWSGEVVNGTVVVSSSGNGYGYACIKIK